jgi:hypothetical protein
LIGIHHQMIQYRNDNSLNILHQNHNIQLHKSLLFNNDYRRGCFCVNSKNKPNFTSRNQVIEVSIATNES